MKNLFLITILLFFVTNIFSQVSGVSASKLATMCASTVEPKIMEFEPSFGFGYSNKYYDDNGKLTNTFANNDSLGIESGLNFRFTYGVINNIEIGTALPADLSGIGFGTKYKLFEKNNLSSAIICGVNLPLGNTVINKTLKTVDNTPNLAGGLVFSFNFNDKNGIDIDCQAQKFVSKLEENHVLDYFIDLDYSYWVSPQFQVIAGLNYYNSKYDNYNENSLILNLGTTIERQKNYLLVLNSPLNLMGKNVSQTFGFGFALTISIE